MKRMKGGKRKYWLAGTALLALVLVPYLWGVALRGTAHECERIKEVSLYSGEICFLNSQYGMRFRLYDAETEQLLAERTYNDLDPGIVWGDDRVTYNLGASPSEYVELPPTWWDRLRAKLP